MTEYDEIMTVMDIVSTRKTNNIATKKANVTSIATINHFGKNLRYCFIWMHFY